ncbi:hypothetical protein Tco_0031392 [Tanacetum coccineum]
MKDHRWISQIDEEVEITNVVIPVNVNEEEEEITDEVYELKRREKGKIVEESRSTPFPTPIRSPRIHTDLGRYTYFVKTSESKVLSRKSFDTLADHLQEVMVESLPTMVDTHIKEQVKKQVPEQVRDQVPVAWKYTAKNFRTNQNTIDNHIPSQVDAHNQDIAIWIATLRLKFENLQYHNYSVEPLLLRESSQDDPHNDAHPEGDNSAKRQKTYEYEAYVSGESSSG